MARSIEKLENDIHQLESRVTENEQLMLEPDIFNDTKKAKQIHLQIEKDNDTLETLLEEWERLQLSLDDAASK
ncbi:ABC transporter C-terminal domain-containing protein [Terrilactibacillus sp. S3-3]|nr:ABC transporter C-terminal domain-containing protein [Terrilactibacillus sp. S3-3]